MHDGKSVLYYGPVRNMKLQKDTISHVVLRFPTKTYMDMGQHLKPLPLPAGLDDGFCSARQQLDFPPLMP